MPAKLLHCAVGLNQIMTSLVLRVQAGKLQAAAAACIMSAPPLPHQELRLRVAGRAVRLATLDCKFTTSNITLPIGVPIGEEPTVNLP